MNQDEFTNLDPSIPDRETPVPATRDSPPAPAADSTTDPATIAGSSDPSAAQGLTRFLPVPRHILIRVLAEESALSGADRDDLVAFAGLLGHMFHFLFHQETVALKRDYAVFDPDAEGEQVFRLLPEERLARARRFAGRFQAVLERANYHYLPEEELNELLSQASPWALRLRVDLSQFRQFCLYYRGNGEEERSYRDLRSLYRKKVVRYPVFHRLALLVQFRNADALPREGSPDHIYLKLFKNIPRADLEMLFPNTIPEMKLLDKIKVAAPLVSGTGATVIKIVGAAAISMFAALLIAAGFIGYAVKSFFGFLRIREKYQGTLVSNLYFNSLDNNAGVIHHLIDQAEEEESKEALLAYYFLLTEPEVGADEATLDGRIERFLQERFGVAMDFEAPDALAKLKRLKLLDEDGTGHLKVPSLKTALCRLDRAWDEAFSYE